MILEIAGWKLDIDLEATMEYSAQEAREHCTCAYCRNFYATIDAQYPHLRPFLAQFGLDIEAPEELLPYDDAVYEAVYAVKGRILEQGRESVEVEGIPIYIQTDSDANIFCPKPYFVLNVGLFQLPWVLEEPFEEVTSTANAPGFLKRMLSKLLGKSDPTKLQ